jgi:small subunit ribosomal protein S21
LEIKVNENDLEKALKILKRNIQRDGLMEDLKKRRYYDKPSVRLKNKKRASQKRKAKSLRRNVRARLK